ncbi:hypothetical protein [Nocardia mexicana]|uniref:Thymidylate kinase n=1 Tax=Nocardia mexicana TaxID=279262 RepID=A0A370GMI5_9NOCA|nr:hypothetical protein [Nocardia mexicana]RDI44935.1 hypothetical protein DFR68_11587 [Nocardia mexicana]
MPTRRVAVVGIDGAGKSSVLAELRRQAPASAAAVPVTFAALTCPDFHDTRDVPLADLSRDMRAFSVGCDELGSLELKATAMYLQMTLFGPVERHILDTFAPEVLVFERHPLIELQVYGPLYTALARPGWVTTELAQGAARVLDRHRPGAFDDIQAWVRAEARRLGTDTDVWTQLTEIGDILGRGLADNIAAFSARLRTTLPDTVLWLDAPPDQAAARCAARAGDGQREMHETAERLTALRHSYLATQELFAREYPDIEFHRIDTADEVDLAESVRACVAEGKLFE